MPTAKFPGQSCVVCGAEFNPGETEIEVHPTITGPKGGKKYVHANPAECGGAHSNPFASTNAGRRMMYDRATGQSVQKHGRKPARTGSPAGPQAGKDKAYIHAQDLRGMGAKDLASLSTSTLEVVAQAVIGELAARERSPSGRKTAWGEGPAPKFANVRSR